MRDILSIIVIPTVKINKSIIIELSNNKGELIFKDRLVLFNGKKHTENGNLSE